MTAPIKIGVLFNELEKSAQLLKGLRRRYPEAYVVAVVPERAAPAPEATEGADEVLPPIQCAYRYSRRYYGSAATCAKAYRSS